MSTSPYWMPDIPQKLNSLPRGIKYPLARKYQDHDGSLSGENILNESDIPYLEGLLDGGINEISEGAKQLIAAIKKYTRIIFIIKG